MGDVAVQFAIETVKLLVESLIQHVNDNKQLIADALVLTEKLEDDKNVLTTYLKEATVNKPKSNKFLDTTLLTNVRESVYKAEDTIDSFASELAARKSKCYSGAIPYSSTSVVKLIEKVAESVKEIRQKVEEQCKGTDSRTENEAFPDYEGEPPNREFCCIFEKEEESLKARLAREAKQPDVIFITGAHGIGKTYLAAKMFLDPDIKKQFNKHIWVNVHNPTLKNILLVILKQLSEDTTPKTDNFELRMQVQKLLEGEKLLLVLDNVPEMSNEDFGNLRNAFGKSDKRSKVLITTNNEKLAPFVRDDYYIKLKPLKSKKSWALLEWQHFSTDPYDPEYKIHGELIAAKCNGLPREIISAGDELARRTRYVEGPREKINVWKHFSRGVVATTLSSYSALPYHLRPCFLYLRVFPCKSKFLVSKLFQMWIAEGFIPQRQDFTLEQTAEEYLMELVDRNLVTVEEERPDGSPKTCSIDESVYNFCKEESVAEGENNRRYCIHADVHEFIKDFKSLSRRIGLHSFVSHSADKDEVDLDRENISIIRAPFKLLRVLDAKPIKVKKIYRDLCLLIHLRYVTLSLNGAVLPASISNLRNVRTLKVHTKPSTTLEIKADILTMVELRHFKTNASATFPKKSKASINYQLQTLCGISPKSCTQEFFSKIPNLRKLGICGQLALLFEKIELLCNLDKVEKLQLLNQVTGRKSEGDLSRLLDQSLPTPPKLMSLTLSATSLKWEHLSNPGWMQKLEELKLKDNAFVGKEWKVSGDGFPNLQTLHIECLDFIRWHASSNQFPRLRRLKLSECEVLRGIPMALADVPTFGELHLHKCRFAVESAKSIRDEKQTKKKADKSITFKLIPKNL